MFADSYRFNQKPHSLWINNLLKLCFNMIEEVDVSYKLLKKILKRMTEWHRFSRIGQHLSNKSVFCYKVLSVIVIHWDLSFDCIALKIALAVLYESIIYLFMRLLFFILGYAISILVRDMGHTKGYRPPDVLPMYKHTYT